MGGASALEGKPAQKVPPWRIHASQDADDVREITRRGGVQRRRAAEIPCLRNLGPVAEQEPRHGRTSREVKRAFSAFALDAFIDEDAEVAKRCCGA